MKPTPSITPATNSQDSKTSDSTLVSRDRTHAEPVADERAAQLDQWLVSFDDALAQGGSPRSLDLSHLPDDLRDDALGMAQLLRQLNQLGPGTAEQPLQPLDKIGRFQIVSELGRGAHGLVFLAHDPLLEREVALKVPRTEVALSGELLRRFRLEAQAAASLDHRHIVAVHEVGDDGISCYIASAYCKGPTLAAWMREHGPVAPHEAARLVADLADAVEQAHRRGILHRDIKPGNVLLDPPDDSQASRLSHFTAKLSDFGLAKVAEHASDDTRSGTLLGTPAYMSPEQASGQLRAIGPTTDVYALGTVLYELLTGAAPFRGQSDADTLRRVVSEEAAPLRRLRAEVSPDLEAICLKCLEKQPQARYATAADLKADLERFLSAQPTLARPLSMPQRVWRWGVRKPAHAALVIVSAAALSLISVGGWWSAGKLSDALDAAQHAYHHSQELLYGAQMRIAYDAWHAGDSAEIKRLLGALVPAEGEPDLREFSWHLLQRHLQRERMILRGHVGEVYGVAYSPDGKTIASTGQDNTVRLWDAETGAQLAAVRNHILDGTCVRFSPDGRFLASGSEDRSVHIRDAQTCETVQVLRGHSLAVLSVDFSADGRRVAAGGRDKSVCVWDLDSPGKPIWRGKAHDRVYAVRFREDPPLLIAACQRERVHVWSTEDWRELEGIDDTRFSFNAVAMDPDRKQVAVSGRDHADEIHKVWLCDLRESGLVVRETLPTGHADRIESLEFSPNGRQLLSASKDGTAIVRSVAVPGDAVTLPERTDRAWCATWSPDGTRIVTVNGDGTIRQWEYSAARSHRVYELGPSTVWQVAQVESNSDHWWCAFDHTGYCEVNLRTGVVRQMAPEAFADKKVQGFSADGRYLITSAEGHPTILWDRTTQEQQPLDPIGDGADIDISRDNRFLVYREGKTGMVIFDRQVGAITHRLDHSIAPTHAWIAPDNRRLLTHDLQLHLWDLATGQRLHTLGDGKQAGFSHSGRTVTAVIGRWVKVLDAETGDLLNHFVTPATRAAAAALHPDDRTLAVATISPNAVVLYDLRTQAQLASLPCSIQVFAGIAFTPDGNRLLAWGCDSERTRSILCEWNITPTETIEVLAGAFTE